MPLMPMAGQAPGGLMPPPSGPGGGLMPPPPAPMPPAAAVGMAMGPLAAQQEAETAAQQQQHAMQTIQAALAAMASQPNPLAEAAVTEPGPQMDAGVQSAPDPNATNGGY